MATRGCVKAIAAQVVVHDAVDLKAVKAIPLKTKRRRVGLGGYKSGDSSNDRELCMTYFTFEHAIDNFACRHIRQSDGSNSQHPAAFEAHKRI
jgi:hypothetical protein